MDLVLIGLLGLPANIDSIHAPLVLQNARTDSEIRQLPGFLSLNAWVPSVHWLSWAELAEFRKEPALVEFRTKLVAVEQNTRAMLERATEDEIRYACSQILHDELLEEIKSLRPSAKGVATDIGLDVSFMLVGTLIPPLGLITNAVSLATKAKEAKELFDQRSSWITALMELRAGRQ